MLQKPVRFVSMSICTKQDRCEDIATATTDTAAQRRASRSGITRSVLLHQDGKVRVIVYVL
jgi:hypothetical protein